KGLYPISVVRKKTLFQLLAEKALAASKAYKKELPIAFMTSHQNHDETVSYFKEHANFGINPLFFTQDDLPFLDKSGNPIKQGDRYVQGPDGNGRAFEHLKKASILDKWEKQGIKYLNVILIDNPLA
ncbi:MAG: UTP--glucose-1-phosphate uridylyltransferase, partial [Parachlamydiaceae bacterium]